MDNTSLDSDKVGTTYARYADMKAFLENKIQTRQGFVEKRERSHYPKRLVITSINGGRELPFVTQFTVDGSAVTYQMHVDRLFHHYDPVDEPAEGWPTWFEFY